MTNKNLPDLSTDKKTDLIKDPADTKKPEMGSARSVNQGGNSGSHPEAIDDRRDLTRKSDATVPNPGRDITTGSDGFDGQGRDRMNDENRDLTKADHIDKGADREGRKNAAQDEHRNTERKGTKE